MYEPKIIFTTEYMYEKYSKKYETVFKRDKKYYKKVVNNFKVDKEYLFSISMSKEVELDEKQSLIIKNDSKRIFNPIYDRDTDEYNEKKIYIFKLPHGELHMSEIKSTHYKATSHHFEIEIILYPSLKDVIQIKYYIAFILKLIQKSDYFVTSLSDKTMVLNHYKDILSVNYFIGAQPETLQKSHLKLLKKDYSVTLKADGERVFLFINDDGIYYIDSNMNVHITDMNFIPSTGNTYILDCEMIKGSNNDVIFLLFDIIVDNGKDIRGTLNLKERFDVLKKIHMEIEKTNTYSVELKEYIFDFTHKDIQKLLENPLYKNDGLIFTPINVPYPKTKKWSGLYKWKPANLNSIDFYSVKKGNDWYLHVQTFEDGKYDTTLFDTSKLCKNSPLEGEFTYKTTFSDLDPTTNKPYQTNTVIEYSWSKEQNKFYPLRTRWDKTLTKKGNFSTVACDIWYNIHNPIEEKDFNIENEKPVEQTKSIDLDISKILESYIQSNEKQFSLTIITSGFTDSLNMVRFPVSSQIKLHTILRINKNKTTLIKNKLFNYFPDTNYLNTAFRTKQNVIVFDLPFENTDYIKEEKIEVFLDNISIIDIVKTLFKNKYKLVFDNNDNLIVGIRVPTNYDFGKLEKELKPFYYPRTTSLQKPLPEHKNITKFKFYTNVSFSKYNVIILNSDDFDFNKKIPDDVPSKADTSKVVPYYVNKGTDLTSPSRAFNNYVKSILLYWAKHKISKQKDSDNSLFDLSCGRGGDLMKWYGIGYKRVLGTDIDKAGIDEAYRRMKEKRKTDKEFDEWTKKCELFVADTSKYLNDDTKLSNYVLKQLEKKFDVGVSFFTAHYYFKNEDKMRGFFKNLSKTIKKNGFAIVTCFDGDSVFNLLKNVDYNESISGTVENETVWEIKKKYADSTLTKKTGVAIDIKFESISNEFITEYLVQSDYFLDIAKEYGLSLVENAKEIGLSGTGTFKDILDVVKSNLDKLETNKIGKPYYKEIKKFIEDPKYKDLQVWNNLNRYYILQLS